MNNNMTFLNEKMCKKYRGNVRREKRNAKEKGSPKKDILKAFTISLSALLDFLVLNKLITMRIRVVFLVTHASL